MARRMGARGRRLPTVVRYRSWEPLIEAADRGRDRALIAVMLYGGLRVSEACSLDVRDLDFEGEQFRVVGKGDKERLIFVHPRLATLLRDYLKERGTPRAGDALFLGERGTRLSRRQAGRIVKAMGERAGVGDIHPHTLRHSCATRLIETGARLDIVKDHLGHADISTTTIYLHIADPERQRAIRGM